MAIAIVKTLLLIFLVPLALPLGSLSQEPPEGWTSCSTLYPQSPSALELAHNRVEALRGEVFDTNTVLLLGSSLGLSREQCGTLVLVPARNEFGPISSKVVAEAYEVGPDTTTSEALLERLRDYVEARARGHTRACLMAALTNNARVLPQSSADVRALVSKMPLVPASWLQKGDSYNVTNEPGHMASWAVEGEVCRWTTFTLTDGDIGWVYELCFKADGKLAYAGESKCDGKEFDPKHKRLIQDAEVKARERMKKDGTWGRLGSCHEFWRFKKELLKANGVDWKSPSELNPGTCYD